MFTLGKKMRSLRIKRNCNQEVIAITLGISRSTYSNYENDRRTPPAAMLVRLADFYHVPAEYLLQEADHYTAYPAIYNEKMQRFISSFMKLDPFSQGMIRALTYYILKHKHRS